MVNNKDKKNPSFSIIYKHVLRIASIVAIVVLARGIVTNILSIINIDTPNSERPGSIFFCCINTFALVCFVILLIKPDKLTLFSIISFIYGISNLIGTDGIEVGIGYLMFVLGTVALYVRGFFKNYRRIKICILLILFIAPVVSNIFLGIDVFEKILFYILGYTIILSLTIIILLKYLIESKQAVPGQKILDLRKPVADGLLTERDADWLKKILNGEKYSSIAKESAVAEGTMRNKIRSIFKTINVTDRKQFLAIYDKALVISTQEEFQAWKDTLV